MVQTKKLCYFSCFCDKMPDINNLKEEIFILAHDFKGFSPWSLGSVFLGPVVRQNIVM
jgi:hypothetical protein